MAALRSTFTRARSGLRRWSILASVYARMLWLILLRRPYKLSLLLTDGCNLRCQICSLGETRDPAFLSLAEVVRLWDAFPRKPCWINISGGEPTLDRDLERILLHFVGTGRRLIITLTTNGQIDCAPMIARVLERSRRTVVYVSVSMDGFAPEHDAARGRTGAFARAWRTWEHLVELRRAQPLLQAGISTTVSRANLGSVVRFVSEVAPACPDLTINLSQSSEYYRNAPAEAFWNLSAGGLGPSLRAVQAALPRSGLAALLRLSALEWAIAFAQGKPERAVPCTSYLHNVLVSADLGLRDCTLKFRAWNDLAVSRSERLEAIAAALQAPRQRRRAIRAQIRADGCERSCHTPCEKYVHTIAALVHPRHAPTVLFAYLRACWRGRRAARTQDAERRVGLRGTATP